MSRAAAVRKRNERSGDRGVNDLKMTDGINSVLRKAFMMSRVMSHKNVCAQGTNNYIHSVYYTPTPPLCHSPLQLLKTPLLHTYTQTHTYTHAYIYIYKGSNQQLDDCVHICMYTRDYEVYTRPSTKCVYSGAYDWM